LNPVLLVLRQSIGKEALVDLVARLIGGEVLLAAGPPVGALVIHPPAQPVAPVDTLAVERQACGESLVVAVARGQVGADLALPAPALEHAGGAERLLLLPRGECRGGLLLFEKRPVQRVDL